MGCAWDALHPPSIQDPQTLTRRKMASDYLPLTGGFTIQQFCDGAAKSRRNAKESYVIKVELFKDTRVEDWWRHELLIFTVVNPGGEGRSLLVFDRGRPDPEDQVDPQTFTQFVLAGFRGDSEDRMQFVEIDGDDIRMKVEHSVRGEARHY
ncbi:hypothetical protein FA13DRAFT_1463991 [Coprinellus micaceus]|uniref:Uncharacterized protein n=1 Tax=Coprinellus micaceus TaxID=71717 RepID=A0A4Y7SNP0_COPMI|nr:hypothetical protein FA13DRAFT_1463991 [Coprinellus micaceus]